MLSIVDLLRAGTVDLPLASYLVAAMRAGASLLVGANPGGAGKTTVMGALLNFLPDETSVRPIEGRVVLEQGLKDTDYGSTCYLAHEIGEGVYYAYVWGEEARTFFSLASRGHIIVSNLHADTLTETRSQLCDLNDIDPAHLNAVELKIYLRLDGRGWRRRRWLSHVYECDGACDRLIWRGEGVGSFSRQAESSLVTGEETRFWHDILSDLNARDIRSIEEVRRAVVNVG
jgi:DNA polymerase III delta prime subunit